MNSVIQFLDMQYPRRHIHEPIDQVDPVTLVWYFFGYSQPYRLFIALSELVLGMLIIIPNTSRLGVLLYFPFALNIAVMTWCFTHTLPVKVVSTFIAISSFYLIIRELSTYKKLLL
ncbi:hypothetical protein [Spirosoma endbachense]|uniref:DoxX family protein n=1 Tax=Spirosoma endbachense TaxID=2666025 RepID=A0A6P1W2X8_9BACT|nr:hypothetical protein [Spirosoma endbachense]QHV99405.1 hypothetical protein GJR95_32285 [Spirosoma endbachense]